MKYKMITLLSIMLLSLAACGKIGQENKGAEQQNNQEAQLNIESMEKLPLFSSDDPAWLIQGKIEEVVLGTKREDILSVWGEPDGMLSGLFGDIFNLENGWYTILYYDDYESGFENAVVSAVRVRNKDENVPLRQGYTYLLGDEEELLLPSVTLDAQNGHFSISVSSLSSRLGYGEYRTEGNTLILETSDENYRYVFTVDGGNLIFDKENSSSMTWFADIPDGAVFEP